MTTHTTTGNRVPKCMATSLVNGANASARALYAGSLDDPSWYRPSRDIYVASAQPWAAMDPDLPKDEGMPRR